MLASGIPNAGTGRLFRANYSPSNFPSFLGFICLFQDKIGKKVEL
jgi:hypothetical protein